MIGSGQTLFDSSTVSGRFVLNGHAALVLFDTGTDKSFISAKFCKTLDRNLAILESKILIELADGKTV